MQCCIPRTIAEISTTIKDLLERCLGGEWQLTVKNFYQVVTPIEATLPDVVSFLEQVNTSPGTWYATIDLGNVFLLYTYL